MDGIRIIAKKDGFRRAGIAHHGTRDYPASQFSAEQLEQLRSEPLLVVQAIDLPEDKPAAGKTNK